MNRRALLLLFVFLCLAVGTATAQPTDDRFDFWLSEPYVRDLAAKNTILYPQSLWMDHRSKVHPIGDDCEIHIAASSFDSLASPSAVVVEPPNLCKERAPDMPASSETKLRDELWPDYLDQHIMGRQCEVTGFPRIFTEHAAGNADPANPNHVLEVHPAPQFTCDGSTLDARGFLKAYPKMRQVKDQTAHGCIEKRQLFVRKDGTRYLFREQGGQCGNFALFHTQVFPQWVRRINGGHSAIARVAAGDFGAQTLKIYTF